MEQRLQEIFDHAPKDPPRSRLEPFKDLILKWRRQGRTYKRISELLANECGVKVGPVTLYRFIQRRSRPRKVEQEPGVSRGASVPTQSPEPLAQPIPRTYTKLKPEEAEVQRELVRAIARKPVIPLPEDPRPKFVYDPNRPLTNKPTEKDKE